MRVDSIITIIVRDGTLIGRKDTVLCEDAYRWLLERGQYLSSRVLLFDMLSSQESGGCTFEFVHISFQFR